jgi:predicted transcriptional regulator of viral defense system
MYILRKPSWTQLNEVALNQRGYFTVMQAREAGFSRQLLRKHVQAGRIHSELYGVYRLTVFPHQEHDELVGMWLWTEGAGVFSHETALMLYQLSDVLPAHVHMTVPYAWRRRPLMPTFLVLHRGQLPESDRTWVGSVPVTTAGRAIRDVFDAGLDPALIAQAIAEGKARKLLANSDVRGILPRRRTPKVR